MKSLVVFALMTGMLPLFADVMDKKAVVLKTVETAFSGTAEITCADTKGWSFDVSAGVDDGRDVVTVRISCADDAEPPKFKECARHPKADGDGFVLYYTDQCPFTYYWVPKVEEAAKENGIPLKTIHITDKETARNVPAPVTTYALFCDGKFITHSIQSDKKFLALAGVRS